MPALRVRRPQRRQPLRCRLCGRRQGCRRGDHHAHRGHGLQEHRKDTELFNKIAEALAGKNILVLSARDENYKTVGASAGLAYGQKVGAESAVDINLAKQLNTVMTQLGVNAQSIVMNIGSAAAGYGYEYVASSWTA